MASATNQLEQIANALTAVALHSSIRTAEDGVPFVFAVGRRRMHSLELQQHGRGYKLSLWKGPDGSDTVAKRVTVDSSANAISEAERWLREEDV